VAYFTIEKINSTNNQGKIKTRYKANVREKSFGKVIFSKSKTFDYKAGATKWAKDLIHSREHGETLADKQLMTTTVKELIERYTEKSCASNKPLGRSAKASLKQTTRYPLGKVRLVDLTSQHIVDFCYDRLNAETKPKPQTVSGDISCLRSVLIHAKSMFNLDIDDRTIIESYPTLKRLRLIAKSDKRSRRLVSCEFEQVLTVLRHYQQRDEVQIPFADLFEMSVLTCLRISELCHLEWKNLIPERSLILVKNRKHPTQKLGNDMLLPLLGEGRALEIIQAQPKVGRYIFPFNSRSVTAGFRRVIRRLGITDLQYRDLRREGCSALIEKGFSLPQVAAVSGHKDLKILHDIYVNVFPDSLIKLEKARR